MSMEFASTLADVRLLQTIRLLEWMLEHAESDGSVSCALGLHWTHTVRSGVFGPPSRPVDGPRPKESMAPRRAAAESTFRRGSPGPLDCHTRRATITPASSCQNAVRTDTYGCRSRNTQLTPVCLRSRHGPAKGNSSCARSRNGYPVRPVVVHRCSRIPESVAIAPAELGSAFEEGIGFDGSSIEVSPGSSESDTVARPDRRPSGPAAGRRAPVSIHSARMFCDITMPDGSPSWADSRHVLRRQLAKASVRVLCYVHPEIEFFLLKARPV